MAEAAIFGLNSGLDTGTIVQKMVQLNQRPIDITVAKEEVEKQKLGAFQQLNTKLLTFRGVARSINTESKFLSIAGTFSNNSATDNNKVVEISTTSSAKSGTFNTKVLQLATESKSVSQGVESITDTIPQGILEINVGSTRTTVMVNSTNNTLDGLRLAINNSGANVEASFINDGNSSNPIRLVVKGKSTGTANAVSIQLYNNALGAGIVNPFTFTETQTARDAIVEIDGVRATKSSNTVTDVISGATLSLKSAGSGVITMQSDIAGIRDKVSTFINGYNDLMQFLDDQLFFDKDSKKTGVLFGNFTVQNIQQSLRSVISNAVPGVTGSYQYLSQIGIQTKEGGFLDLDTAKLTDALNTNAANVNQLFASKGTTSNTNVTYVGFSEDTTAGTYDVRVSGGVPQLSPEGTGSYTNTTGAGNFYTGTSDSAANGLNFRMATTQDGSYGTINLSIGVAELFNRQMTKLVDASRGGPLKAELNSATKSIKDLDDTVIKQQDRLKLFETNLKARFANLETVVGKLNSQKEAFNSSLAGIQAAFANK